MMSSPYTCPRHQVDLVARVLVVHTVRGGTRRVRYFACPRVEECDRCDGCGWWEGGKVLQSFCRQCRGTGVLACDYMKPDKWAKRKRYGQND